VLGLEISAPTCTLRMHVPELTVAACARPGSYPPGPQSAAPAQQAPYNGARPQQPPQASQYGAAPAGYAPSQQPGAGRHVIASCASQSLQNISYEVI